MRDFWQTDLEHIPSFVGDYENDISMICEADIGCAVANAIPELKDVADRILPRVDQDPFVELIYSL